jgi:hypothetical protein
MLRQIAITIMDRARTVLSSRALQTAHDEPLAVSMPFLNVSRDPSRLFDACDERIDQNDALCLTRLPRL